MMRKARVAAKLTSDLSARDWHMLGSGDKMYDRLKWVTQATTYSVDQSIVAWFVALLLSCYSANFLLQSSQPPQINFVIGDIKSFVKTLDMLRTLETLKTRNILGLAKTINLIEPPVV